MFSKRHYEYLADWLKDASMAVADIDRRLVASSLADRLQRDNPRFDRKRFLSVAGANHADWRVVGTAIAAVRSAPSLAV